MIGTIVTTSWVESNLNHYTIFGYYSDRTTIDFDGSNFQGSLLTCEKGCDKLYTAESNE